MPTFTATEHNVTGVPELQYSNLDYAFAQHVINEARQAQRLPLELQPADVFHAIQSQTDMFYELAPYATEDDLLSFDMALVDRANQKLRSIDTEGKFKLHTNELLLPDAVYAIYEVFYQNHGQWERSAFSVAQWRMETVLNTALAVPGAAYGIDDYFTSLYCCNLLDSVSKEPVLYRYNNLTHILKIDDLGVRSGLITCRVSRKLQPSQLYQDPYYRRFILSHTLNQKCDQLELFGTQTPGDTQLNVDVIRRKADKLMEDVTEHLKAETDNDYFAIKT